jgi:nucleotide-binding universal stress UspA family protein
MKRSRRCPAMCTSRPASPPVPPAHELAAQSELVDLMVVGSRGYGPRAAVLLGSVTHTLLRKAACPVVVLPRGSRGLEPLFAPEAETATS